MNSLPAFYFLHGWGYDQSYWDPFLQGMQWKGETIKGEMGFFGTLPSAYPLVPFIGIGHSLGFLKMLKDWPLSMKALVGINPFPRFCQAEDFPRGAMRRSLQRMREKLHGEEKEMLSQFWKRVGNPGPDGIPHRDRLMEGLFFLEKEDQRAQLKTMAAKGKILLLVGKKDPILALESEDFQGQEVHFHEEAGHDLALRYSAWCWDRIFPFAGQNLE